MPNKFPYSLRFTNEFEKRLSKLAKKYRNIKQDIQPIIEQLGNGNILGDRLAGFGEDTYIYKLRIRNSNIKKGKSGGYRLIYFLQTKASIILLTIYSKSETEDISVKEINSILSEFFDD